MPSKQEVAKVAAREGISIADAERLIEWERARLVTCTRCGEERKDVEERYSFGAYAGRLCTPCCHTYADHCGVDQPQGDPRDLDEFAAGGWDAIDGEPEVI